MDSSSWKDDILACYPVLINRLKNIENKFINASLAAPTYLFENKVFGAKDLTAISNSKAQIPLNGSVYVIYDGLMPTSTNDNKRGQTMVIGFSVILTMRNSSPKPTLDTKPNSAIATPDTLSLGQMQTAIMKALQGYEPRQLDDKGKETGGYLTTSPFKQVNAMPIRYEDGFAYFPMRFTAEVAVIAD